MYFVRHPEVTLVGASPEPLVRLRDGQVISRPIAGTRYRGRTEEEDRRLGAELAEHPKEVAEHVMLVDLARNDVGRVVRFGTCQVDEMMTLERYSHVMHLTSQVSGELADGRTPIDVLRATHPGRHPHRRPQGAGHGDHRRPRARRSAAPTAGWSATSTSAAPSTPPSPSAPWSACPTAGRRCRPAPASWPTRVPEHEELECRNKARALLAAVPAARRMTAARRAAVEGTPIA